MSDHRNKDYTFMRIAWELSALGTCNRKHVGAVIVRDGRCITWGYNGAPPGLPHCDENDHGWGPNPHNPGDPFYAAFEEGIADGLYEVGCRNATHAEANALAFAARQGISTDGGTLYVTCSPCDTCSRLLVAAGINRVVYDELYRDSAGKELLERIGIDCVQVTS